MRRDIRNLTRCVKRLVLSLLALGAAIAGKGGLPSLDAPLAIAIAK